MHARRPSLVFGVVDADVDIEVEVEVDVDVEVEVDAYICLFAFVDR